jgi:hypothetical protein
MDDIVLDPSSILARTGSIGETRREFHWASTLEKTPTASSMLQEDHCLGSHIASCSKQASDFKSPTSQHTELKDHTGAFSTPSAPVNHRDNWIPEGRQPIQLDDNKDIPERNLFFMPMKVKPEGNILK